MTKRTTRSTSSADPRAAGSNSADQVPAGSVAAGPSSAGPGSAASELPAAIPAAELDMIELEPATVPSGSYQQWVNAAAGVLRKAGRLPERSPGTSAEELAATVVEKLARSIGDGVRVPPLGRLPELPENLPAGRRSPRVGAWDIRSMLTFTDPAAAASCALAELEGGATSLVVTVGGGDDGAAGVSPDDLAAALEPVLVDIAAIVLQPNEGYGTAAVQAFSAFLRDRAVTPAAGTSFGLDPCGAALDGRPGQELTAAIVTAARDLGVGVAVVDGRRVHELGGEDVTEIGWSIAAGIATLRLLVAQGVTAEQAAGLLSFRYAVTDDQFSQIAKLRAARAIWARVLELSGIDAVAHPQYQHAVTSRPMTSRYDPWINMLRGTIAAFAAGVGGAQAVTTLPFDTALGVPDGFGRRIARNVSHLLIGESRVAEVADPVAGAAAVEVLTLELADAAWTLLQQLEAAGGAGAPAAQDAVRTRAAQERRERERRIATRWIPLTGISEFPHLEEKLPNRVAAGYDGFSWPAAYELLRDTPCATPVFLATLGPVAAHAARAGFVTGALAAGGIVVQQAVAPADTEALATAFRAAGTGVAALVGTDEAYTELGAVTIGALRAAGATTVLIAGKPPAALAQLVDGSVALGDDIPALATMVRAALDGASA